MDKISRRYPQLNRALLCLQHASKGLKCRELLVQDTSKKPALFLLNSLEDLIRGVNEATFAWNCSGVCHCVRALRAAIISASEGSRFVGSIKECPSNRSTFQIFRASHRA